MMKNIFAGMIMLVAFNAQAQIAIDVKDAKKHAGDSVTVCTTLYGGIYLDKNARKPTLLNAGAAFPQSPLTLVLWPDVRAKYAKAPEVCFKNKAVCVTGKIELYHDKPQLVVYDTAQIKMAPVKK